MNVVYVSDDKYIEFFGISVISLFENNRDIPNLDVFLLHNGISSENILKINQIAEKYRRSVNYIDVSNYENAIDFEADTCGFNPIILTRLFLGSYIPEYIDEVLYLDCDAIIDGSIAELENIEIDNYLVAAVPELLMHDEYKQRIGLSASDVYFNSGVLLINLKLWREKNLARSFTDFLRSHNGELLFADQDIINACCKGRIKALPVKYNYSPNMCWFPNRFIKRIHSEFNLCEKYVIIHFLGDERPWFRGNFNRYKEVFYKYKNLSPWKSKPLIKGREAYLFGYHCLNLLTSVCPQFRVWFSKNIGMKKFKVFGKE